MDERDAPSGVQIALAAQAAGLSAACLQEVQRAGEAGVVALQGVQESPELPETLAELFAPEGAAVALVHSLGNMDYYLKKEKVKMKENAKAGKRRKGE